LGERAENVQLIWDKPADGKALKKGEGRINEGGEHRQTLTGRMDSECVFEIIRGKVICKKAKSVLNIGGMRKGKWKMGKKEKQT
jgi:hypothetical protein